MSSQRRIKASQRNGALSRGPKTAAGKSRSSENATRHGLLAKRVVLANEPTENFEIVVNQHVEKFQPQDGVEFGFVEEMTASYWRLHRAIAIERGLLDEALERHPNGTEMSRLIHAWKDLVDSGSLQTLHRYQASLHRMYQRAMKNLLLLRDIDPKNTELRNEPIPNSEHSEPPPPADPEAPESLKKPAQSTNLHTEPRPSGSGSPSGTKQPHPHLIPERARPSDPLTPSNRRPTQRE